MNTIRNFFAPEIEEMRSLLRAAYAAILHFQTERDNANEKKMRRAIAAILPIIAPFKAYIPAYKARYIEILEGEGDRLTPYDLVVCFDRAIYELHTRLKCGAYSHLPWSETLRELFDERRLPVSEAPRPETRHATPSVPTDFLTRGNPVTPFMAEGPARIVRNRRDLRDVCDGEILVTEMSDPDFVCVADRIVGLVTDYGGLVCHAAILAREWNLPCIVGCRDATALIRDGQRIRMDGATGTVTGAS